MPPASGHTVPLLVPIASGFPPADADSSADVPRIWTMLRSFLAGAAVGACVDAWTMIPVPASSALPREYLLVTVVGTMLAAGVFALLLADSVAARLIAGGWL